MKVGYNPLFFVAYYDYVFFRGSTLGVCVEIC